MSNYSGTAEQKLQKRREYDARRQSNPEYREAQRLRRQTPEYKAILAAASKRHRSTPEYKAYARAYKQTERYKRKRRDSLLRKQFGIGLDEYEVMLANQNGVCAICHQLDPARSLAVDHCHETGVVRGLLCRDCNQGIGKFCDKPERLMRAAEYVDVRCNDSH